MSYAQREFFNKRLFLYPCKWFRRSCPVDLQFLYPCRGYLRCFYTLVEGIISVRSLQRSDGNVSDPINIYILDQLD